MIVLSSADFKIMPWKNGGGTTCELYRQSSPQDPEQFLFRLSRAQVQSSGPFSLFPGIDRTLILLEGNGFRLNQSELSQKLKPISFAGEEVIHCELIDGACVDFNVMVKRDWGKTEVTVIQLNPQQEVKGSFIYLPLEHQLICLDAAETWQPPVATQAIVIKLFNLAY